MELIIKSNNERSIAKIIALAKKLNVIVQEKEGVEDDDARQLLRERILNFKAPTPDSFGDAATWQKNEREDRDLPFA